jgi:hypothetical protein
LFSFCCCWQREWLGSWDLLMKTCSSGAVFQRSISRKMGKFLNNRKKANPLCKTKKSNKCVFFFLDVIGSDIVRTQVGVEENEFEESFEMPQPLICWLYRIIAPPEPWETVAPSLLPFCSSLSSCWLAIHLFSGLLLLRPSIIHFCREPINCNSSLCPTSPSTSLLFFFLFSVLFASPQTKNPTLKKKYQKYFSPKSNEKIKKTSARLSFFFFSSLHLYLMGSSTSL